MHFHRPLIDFSLGVDVLMITARGDFTIDDFYAAYFNNAMARASLQPRRLSI